MSTTAIWMAIKVRGICSLGSGSVWCSLENQWIYGAYFQEYGWLRHLQHAKPHPNMRNDAGSLGYSNQSASYLMGYLTISEDHMQLESQGRVWCHTPTSVTECTRLALVSVYVSRQLLLLQSEEPVLYPEDKCPQQGRASRAVSHPTTALTSFLILPPFLHNYRKNPAFISVREWGHWVKTSSCLPTSLLPQSFHIAWDCMVCLSQDPTIRSSDGLWTEHLCSLEGTLIFYAYVNTPCSLPTFLIHSLSSIFPISQQVSGGLAFCGWSE